MKEFRYEMGYRLRPGYSLIAVNHEIAPSVTEDETEQAFGLPVTDCPEQMTVPSQIPRNVVEREIQHVGMASLEIVGGSRRAQIILQAGSSSDYRYERHVLQFSDIIVGKPVLDAKMIELPHRHRHDPWMVFIIVQVF
jgi:hypothetical protein